MSVPVLNELRLMSSTQFDSLPLLCVILAVDARLNQRLRREELIPLGSRIRIRYGTEYASREDLLAFLEHLLEHAGNAALMTPELRSTLCDHAAGNYRILAAMSLDLLAAGAQKNLSQLDEKLYLEVFAPTHTPGPAKRGRA